MKLGKFLFIWKFLQLESGRSTFEMIQQAIDLNLGMVAIKIADGASSLDGSGSDAKIKQYVDQLHSKGIQVWGWHYLYGGRRLVRNAEGKIIGSQENNYSTPEREANIASSRLHQFGLDGYIMDPEAEYKTAPVGRAQHFMNLLRSQIGSSIPVALCSYRYPKYHRELPWLEFLSKTDFHMPQVYWGEGANKNGLLNDGRYLSVVELDESVKQLKALANIPVLPVGRAYIGDGHSNPRPEEIRAFMERTDQLAFNGVGFWNWDSLRPNYPGGLSRLAEISKFKSSGKVDGITCPNCKVFIPFVQK